MKTKEMIIQEIIEYFNEHEDIFNNCIEELDNYDGCLGDDRYYYMEELDDFYGSAEATEVLRRAFFGHDAEVWHYDKDGDKIYGQFNPNRTYFYYNGYGNLVSADYKDYSDKLDKDVVEDMSMYRRYIDSIDDHDTLTELFDELEEVEE